MSVVILIAADTLSNTAETEKTNKLIDDPDRDVHWEMPLKNHDAGHMTHMLKSV